MLLLAQQPLVEGNAEGDVDLREAGRGKGVTVGGTTHTVANIPSQYSDIDTERQRHTIYCGRETRS